MQHTQAALSPGLQASSFPPRREQPIATQQLGIELVTRVRKNMKEVMYSDFDHTLLRKRSLVETVFDELKNLRLIEHTRHRSLMNFAVNFMAGIVAYFL